MRIGFIGLGKMGGNMVERLLKDKHELIVFNKTKPPVAEAESKGAIGNSSIEELAAKLPERKAVWLMVPAGEPVDQLIIELREYLKEGDIIIDGGNSFYKDSIRRSSELRKQGIQYIDCGVSGGVWGLKNGYCLMYGGNKEAADFLEPIFKTLAPKDGYFYCGENGSGHFVKMVHNGIEYGMMQSYAEGFELLEKSKFNLDLSGISKVWQHGSVVQSWLLELASLALKDDPKLDSIMGFVDDSGEGRWAVEAAIEHAVPMHVIASSLFNRFRSRQKESFSMKMLAALRHQFGGHPVKKIKD